MTKIYNGVADYFTDQRANIAQNHLSNLAQQSPGEIIGVLSGTANQPRNRPSPLHGKMPGLEAMASNEAFKGNLKTALQNPNFQEYLVSSFTQGDKNGLFNQGSLNAMMQTAYGQNALNDMVARAGDPSYDFANFKNDATAAGLKHLSGHLAGLEDSSAIFAALQGAAGIIDPQGKGGLNKTLETVRKNGTQGFQDSLAQAVRNPKFLTYLAEKAGDDSSMFSPENLGNILDDVNFSNAGQQILTLIAERGENFDFTQLDLLSDDFTQYARLNERLDGLEAGSEEYAQTQSEITNTMASMTDRLRGMGVAVPLDVDPAILLTFMTDLFTSGDPNYATENLVEKLRAAGMNGDALNEVTNILGPLAGVMQFMVGPYAEFFQVHGPALSESAGGLMKSFEVIAGGLGGERYGQPATEQQQEVSATPAETRNGAAAARSDLAGTRAENAASNPNNPDPHGLNRQFALAHSGNIPAPGGRPPQTMPGQGPAAATIPVRAAAAPNTLG